MAKVSSALWSKLHRQAQGMRSGTIINNKLLTKAVFRLLPTKEEVPGVEYLNLFFVPKKKSSTSPRTFGLMCPVLDVLDQIHRDKDKQQREEARAVVNVQREYWIAVLDRADIGTPENPNLRVHRAKRSVYQTLVNYMLDEDDGEDITNPVDGRDFRVKKEGSGMETEWTVPKIFDKAPIADDPDMAEAIVAAAKTFDVRNHFYDPDFDVIREMYMTLTGTAVPEEYEESWKNFKGTGQKGASEADDSTPADEPEADAEGSDESEADGDGGDEVTVELGMKIKFNYTDDDGEHEVFATVTALTEDEDSSEPAVDCKTEEGDEFTVTFSNLEIVEPEPEPEPEPAPTPPTAVKKKPGVVAKKTATAPKAAPKAKKGAGSAASKIRARLSKGGKKS